MTQSIRDVLLAQRYLQNGESEEGMYRRVAQCIAACDENAKDAQELFFDIMSQSLFLPNSPTLMNAGVSDFLCGTYCIPFTTLNETQEMIKTIHSSGAGVALSLDSVSDPVSVLKELDSFTRENESSYPRPGAHMASLTVTHPKILDFIRAKSNEEELTTFNLSVKLPHSFFELYKTQGTIDLLDPQTAETCGQQNVHLICDEIAKHMCAKGDPGIIFSDTVESRNSTTHLGPIATLDCCGEMSLLENESAVLGSINLSAHMKDRLMQWDQLRTTVTAAIRFLDNTASVTKYPNEHIKEASQRTRRIGLGIMGFADMLCKMGVSYNSKNAQEEAHEVMQFVQEAAYEESERLVKLRGNYPAYDGSFHASRNIQRRNATTLACAPTGSISLLAGCSSGIEPLFSLFSSRLVMGEQYVELNSLLEEELQSQGIDKDEIIEHLKTHNTLQNYMNLSQSQRARFVTAHEVDPKWHLKVTQGIQKHCDGAVSKTVNVDTATTFDMIRFNFLLAHAKNLKGITFYREGSRSKEVIKNE